MGPKATFTRQRTNLRLANKFNPTFRSCVTVQYFSSVYTELVCILTFVSGFPVFKGDVAT